MKKYSKDYDDMYYPTKDYMLEDEYQMYMPKGMKSPYDEYEMDEYYEKDKKYMKKLYPELSRRIQYVVEEECDKIDYDGSWMYDEYPSKDAIEELVAKIYVIIEKDIDMPKFKQEVHSEETDVETQQYYYGGYPWLWDNVQVLFLNELFDRRRRRYPRRYRYYSPYRPYRPRRYLPYKSYVPYSYRYYYY